MAPCRANAQQPKLFVGMILILIFAEALALYGLIGEHIAGPGRRWHCTGGSSSGGGGSSRSIQQQWQQQQQQLQRVEIVPRQHVHRCWPTTGERPLVCHMNDFA